MKEVVEPIIHGLDIEYELDLSDCKRPRAYGSIDFECPECGEITSTHLHHGDTLGYGDFFGWGFCRNCEVTFKSQRFDVITTVKVVKRDAEV